MRLGLKLKELLTGCPAGMTVSTMAALADTTETRTRAALYALKGAYIDRWVIGQKSSKAAVWCWSENPPENCPKP